MTAHFTTKQLLRNNYLLCYNGIHKFDKAFQFVV